MSDLAHTASCDKLPQRIAARIDLSRFTSATSSSSASANFSFIGTAGLAGFLDIRLCDFTSFAFSQPFSGMIRFGLTGPRLCAFPPVRDAWSGCSPQDRFQLAKGYV